MRAKKPTITDVARRAKVAVGTVSNVLNATIPVSAARRARVLKAIEDLGYTQNMLAQGLRRRRSPVVGVCVPHTSIAYFAALVDAFEEIASNRGFEIMQVLSRQDPMQEQHRVKALLRYHVGGLIIVPCMEPETTFELIAQSGVPVVVVDRPPRTHRFDQVTFDNRGAMCDATSRLIALGHRHITFLVRQRSLVVTVERVKGLRDAVRRSGRDAVVDILECGDDASMAVKLRHELQKPGRPTAIIVSNSAFAASALRVIQTLPLRYPEELSLLAFDEPEWADLVSPTLSVVRQPTREIARTAWEFLIKRMKNEVSDVQRSELKAQVMLRGSVVPPPHAAARARRRASAT